MKNPIAKLFISLAILIIIIAVVYNTCRSGRLYTKSELDRIVKENESKYTDTIQFIKGQRALKEEQLIAARDRVNVLEIKIDSLTAKHAITKAKVRPAPVGDYISDTGFVLAPNEYVNECEDCFNTVSDYKKENKQLAFERDSYDSLLRQENRINEKRIINIEAEKNVINNAFKQQYLENQKLKEGTRKLKVSAMGMLNDLFLPNGGGAGLIYEDKKFNEFGGHVLLTGRGNIYLLHIAKTISLKRKK